jgi:glutamate carboxypeptidase
MRRSRMLASLSLLIPIAALAQTTLTPPELRVRQAIVTQTDEQIAYLQHLVDIPSSTLNLAGVRHVGDVLRASLDSLGFTTSWASLPAEVGRAGHVIAEHRGRAGMTRMLLIGHLDTVVDPNGPSWVRTDSTAAGVGANDMKGGDVIILFALKALQSVGALRDLNVTIVFTGDEEAAGYPIETSRKDLIDAAHHNDVALAFEGGNRSDATVARRGASGWQVRATGRSAHSAGIFGEGSGYGAIYELARILDGFRRELAGEQYLTLNTAVVVGGTDVAYDTVAVSGTVASKLNIIPRSAIAHGDLRFISEDQKERARARMRAIVAQHLPGTDATITFIDEYPGMPPTPGGAKLLAEYDATSRALGFGQVEALDPGRRGAGDVSFVAPFIDGLDGLGAMGSGSHTPRERVNLATLPMQTERAALLIRRVGDRPSSDFTRTEGPPATHPTP